MNVLCRDCKHYTQHYVIEGGVVHAVAYGTCRAKPTYKTVCESAKECKHFENFKSVEKEKNEIAERIFSIKCNLKEISKLMDKVR